MLPSSLPRLMSLRPVVRSPCQRLWSPRPKLRAAWLGLRSLRPGMLEFPNGGVCAPHARGCGPQKPAVVVPDLGANIPEMVVEGSIPSVGVVVPWPWLWPWRWPWSYQPLGRAPRRGVAAFRVRSLGYPRPWRARNPFLPSYVKHGHHAQNGAQPTTKVSHRPPEPLFRSLMLAKKPPAPAMPPRL